MSRTVYYLLVIDASSEPAAQINSLLRNSGISIHVLHASNSLEARRLLREFKPLAMIYHPACESRFPVAEAALLASELNTLFGVRTLPSDTGALTEAMRHAPVLGIDQSDDALLVNLTKRLLDQALAAQQHHLAQRSEDEVAARLQLLLETTDEAIAYLHEGLHAAANSNYLKLMGVASFAELEGMSLLELLSSEHHDLKQLIRDLSHGAFPERALPFELSRSERGPMPVTARFYPTRLDGEACVQMVLTRAAKAAPAPEQAPSTPLAPREADAIASDTDPTTGLLRRSVFMKWLERGIDEIPQNSKAALFYLQAADAERAMAEASVADMTRYTRLLGRALSRHVDNNGLACRFGDYSFALLALRDGKTQLNTLAETIQSDIRQLATEEPDLPQPEQFVIGYTLLDAHTHHAETAVSQAREAWREASADGAEVVRFKPLRGIGLDASEETRWAHRLRYALDNEDFYTAQYDVTNLEGETESLVENRTFMHEDEGDVAYDEFLPAAELVGLASSIDRYIIPELFRALSHSKQNHVVNISGSSLQDFSFASWLRREMNNSGIEPRRLVLQWPVSAAYEHPKAARRLIEELKPSGCRFSLSGMDGNKNTLALVSEFEPDYLRLHAQLTSDLRTKTEMADHIRILVQAGRAVGALTIASDINDSSDLAMLWQCGVKLVAGDFLQEAPRVIGA